MTDPLAFLTAALDAAQRDAEAAAERAWSPRWEYDDSVHEIRDLSNGNTLANIYHPEIGNYVAANEPAATLRRIAADRKNIKLHEGPHECSSYDWTTQEINPCMWVTADEHCTTVRNVAEGWGWTEETT